MNDHTGELIEAQVDWLSVSAHGKDAASNMLDWARSVGKEEASAHNRRRRWRLMGYEGWRIGRIAYGQRDGNSTYLQLSGDSANQHLSVALSLADTVTRLDLAATWRADPPDPYLGRNCYSLAEMWYQKHPRAARPWHVEDATGGYTCYLGKRESDVFFRIYNKEAESVENDDPASAERYQSAWRFELEAKASMASGLASIVDMQEERAPWVRDYLASYLYQHGIEAPFREGSPLKLLPGFRRRSDAESRLRHLAKNVAPTVAWLKAEGQEAEARRILGLD